MESCPDEERVSGLENGKADDTALSERSGGDGLVRFPAPMSPGNSANDSWLERSVAPQNSQTLSFASFLRPQSMQRIVVPADLVGVFMHEPI